MHFEDITLVHALPGRVRLKLGEMKNNPALAREVKKMLSAKPGVFRVEVNYTTGSILLQFDPEVIDLFQAANY
jgi:hypothetical protein